MQSNIKEAFSHWVALPFIDTEGNFFVSCVMFTKFCDIRTGWKQGA